MSKQTRRNGTWNQFDDFEPPEPPFDMCRFARSYAEWAEGRCRLDKSTATLITVNQAKLLLLEKYFEWYHYVPKSHRHRVSENGHYCIFHVFHDFYHYLKALEMTLEPPRLFEPPPPAPLPPPKPRIHVPALYLGEIIDESDDIDDG